MTHPWALPDGAAFGILGIINATPDSFYDGGLCLAPDAAGERAERLVQDGAAILDIGAESTRPGAAPIAPEEEWRRLQPVLDAVRARCPDIRISVDTRHAGVASKALAAGAAIINDVSACCEGAGMLDVLIQFQPGYVLMHHQGSPQDMQLSPRYNNVVDEIKAFFANNLRKLVAAGLREDRIVLDPGIGFGKTLAHNLAIMRSIEAFLVFGRPLLAGISMKSWIGEFLGLPIGERKNASAIASALLFQKGVVWHRVHDVQSVRLALALAQSLQTEFGGRVNP